MAMPTPSAHSCPDTDVLVVGHGPVGQVLGILLAQRGWLTTVVDPSSAATSIPSVIGFDSETMRVLASAGLGTRLRQIGVPAICLEFENATLRFSQPKRWACLTLFHQPALQAALADRERKLPNLTVVRGVEAALLVDRGGYAEVVAGGDVITASWVVGCDGMHSFHHETDRWRSGRILLAGDSANLAPLLAGPGMCAGIRDSSNLAWKLDLVLRDRANEALLDSYAVERQNPRRLSSGVVHPATGDHTGQLLPQASVATADQRGALDDVVGRGFVLMSTAPPKEVLTDRLRAFLHDIDAHVVQLLPAGTPLDQAGGGTVVDVDDVYLPYLAEAGEIGALVRPDFYLFGTAHDECDLADLVDDLREQLFRRRFRPRPIE
ncbi:FAD-dependent monooxygenase [Lentzea tibetensis]|nr:FAD-dependent monooxygenase [Lentzea tibetensis]